MMGLVGSFKSFQLILTVDGLIFIAANCLWASNECALSTKCQSLQRHFRLLDRCSSYSSPTEAAFINAKVWQF